MSLTDQKFLKDHDLDATIQRMERPISVRGIGSKTYSTAEYVLLNVWIHAGDTKA